MGCSSSIAAPEPSVLLALTEKEVQGWVNSLPENVKLAITGSGLLPCNGILLHKWSQKYLQNAGIQSEIMRDQIMMLRTSLSNALSSGRKVADLVAVRTSPQSFPLASKPSTTKEACTQVTSVVEVAVTTKSTADAACTTAEDILPFSKQVWNIEDKNLPTQTASLVNAVKNSLPSPGGKAASTLATMITLASKVVCNQANIYSLLSRLLEITQVLRAHANELSGPTPNARRVVSKYHDLCQNAHVYMKPFASRNWLTSALAVEANRKVYASLDSEITQLAANLKLALSSDLSKDVEDALSGLEKAVEFEGLECEHVTLKVEELGGLDSLASNPAQLTNVISVLSESGKKNAAAMQNQVALALRTVTPSSLSSYILQPDLRTFWALKFSSKSNVPWSEFWKAVDASLKDVLLADELEAVMQLLTSDARSKLQTCLVCGADEAHVSVLDLRFRVPAVTPLAEALQHALRTHGTAVRTLPGCIPLPQLVGPIIGRQEDVQAVVDMLVPSPSSVMLRELLGCQIIGPGGYGKSRLAMAAARELVHRGEVQSAGAVFVDLQAARTVDEVAGRLWAALGMDPERSISNAQTASIVASHVSALCARGRVLLVLDNAEDALEDESSGQILQEIVHKLRTIAPAALLLITSRVPCDWPMSVKPLPTYTLKALTPASSKALVQQCDMQLTDDEVASVVNGCAGVPMAILLATEALAFGITDSNAYATGLKKEDPKASITFLLSVLPPEFVQMLASLSVFSSSFSLDDTAIVLSSPLTDQIITQITMLASHNLLQLNLSFNTYSLSPLVKSCIAEITKAEVVEARAAAEVQLVHHLVSQLQKWAKLAEGSNSRANMALSLARLNAGMIDAGLTILSKSVDQLPVEAQKTVTEGLSQCSVLDFMRAFGMTGRTDLLQVAGKIAAIWEGTAAAAETPLLLASASLLKAVCLLESSNHAEARPLLESCIEIRKEKLGTEHEGTLGSMRYLADFLYDDGQYAAGQTVLESLLEAEKRVLGPEHLSILLTMNHLALCLKKQDKLEAACEMYEAIYQIQKADMGPEDHDTLVCMNNLASCLQDRGEFEKASAMYESVIEVEKQCLGAEHPEVLVTMSNLASCFHAQQKTDVACEIYEKILNIRAKLFGPEHSSVLSSTCKLATCLLDLQKYDVACTMYRKVLDVRTRLLGREHPDVLKLMGNVAYCLACQENFESARHLYERIIEVQKRVLPPDSPELARSIDNLERCSLGQQKMEAAQEIDKFASDERLKKVSSLKYLRVENH